MTAIRPDKASSGHPLVTVIMPIRNEAGYIARALASVLAQDYPADRMEILVVDGMSGDGTREIVGRMISGATTIELLDNPAGIVPTALNIGLRRARGAVIIRVDGHCEIAPDYVRRCVAALAAMGADCVGGPIITTGETAIAQAIALAQSTPFGVGGAAFRVGRARPGYVDTLAFGAYRCEVFARIGGFDEELARNQDDEFNLRLTQAGGKIWLDPAIRSVYYSRSGLGKLWRQYFQYGFYKVLVIRKRRAVASWRHLAPAAFALGLLGSLLLALCTRRPRWLLGVAGPYMLANGLASVVAARRNWRALPLLPPVFLTLHLSYGLGFCLGVLCGISSVKRNG